MKSGRRVCKIRVQPKGEKSFVKSTSFRSRCAENEKYHMKLTLPRAGKPPQPTRTTPAEKRVAQRPEEGWERDGRADNVATNLYVNVCKSN